MKLSCLGILVFLMLSTSVVNSQVILSGTSYSQNFDNISAGLPTGFSVYTGANASSAGTLQTFITSATTWSSATGQFRNSASLEGLTSSSNTAAQSASTDRVIGLRQAASFGDPGAAFVMQLSNTTGFSSFTLSFKLQSLDIASPRTTNWSVDYGIGTTPSSFTAVATLPVTITTGGSSFTNTTVNVDFGTALDNINQTVWIRIVALSASSGSGTRPTTGIDDLLLNYSNGSGCTPPSVQATAASISNIGSSSIDISWTPGNGTNSLVVVRQGSPVAGSPANGTSYTANTVFGSGQTIAANEYVVYAGTGNSVSISSLSPGTTYYAAVFTFNASDNCYLSASPAQTNATTVCPEPAIQASGLSVSPGINFAIINWTTGNGNSSLVRINTVNSFSAPVDGIVYAANSTYSGGEQTIYTGGGNSMTVSGLNGSTTYYVTVYSFNTCTSNPDYLVTANPVQSFTTSSAGAYYSSINTQNCSVLKTALRDIITAGHVQLDYGDIDDLHHPTTDDRLNDAGTQTIVWDIYSDNPTGPEPYEFSFSQFATGGSAEGQGWNKEHTFPNSWFSASSSTNNFPGSDLHQVFPTDIYVNSQRGNLPYGLVASASNTYLNGSKRGTSSVTLPGYSGQVFEPIDAYKGDVARVFFYMITRYENDLGAWESLEATGDAVMDGLSYPGFEINYLKMLLAWHSADPVSAKEIARNNDVFSFQGNRNPFVDHPEYVGRIWAQSCGLALPVEIENLIIYRVGEQVTLSWTVERAEGFDRFEIERSFDGISYSRVGNIAWQSSVSSYSFMDDVSEREGKVFYRLKLVDQNNSYKYSKVLSITLPTTSAVLISPNPASSVINLSFKKTLGATRHLVIIDATGKRVADIAVDPGVNAIQVQTSRFSNGLYILQWRNGNELCHLKFIIRK